MFDFLKKKDKGIEIGSPVKGKAVPISKVSDPTFGEEILGKGVAIQPADGKIYAPADGTIEMLFDTKHAVSMTTTEGVELLVHIGLDTVALKGEHFTAHKENGDAVKKGDLLISVDLEAVKAAGYDVITPMVVCNTSDYQTVEAVTGSDVNPGDTVLILKK
ncbi:MAG: PTS glucose transporter subunit IIA [Roseburia inulinivorans]|nr:PTS glucose transporter subunit IIA [bacterium]MDY3039040.1 PTS glucose transporter subunit IIA [Roseburia inulinivorans]